MNSIEALQARKVQVQSRGARGERAHRLRKEAYEKLNPDLQYRKLLLRAAQNLRAGKMTPQEVADQLRKAAE